MGAVEKHSYPKGHHGLRRCAANRTAQRIKIYASRFDFCAPSISALLNSPEEWRNILISDKYVATSNQVSMMKKSIIITTLILFILTSVSNNALSFDDNKKDVGQYSHKLYKDRDEARVVCGDFRVIAFSDYNVGVETAPPHKQYQEIIRQYFEFTDLKKGDKKMILSSYPYGKENLDSNDKFINTNGPIV